MWFLQFMFGFMSFGFWFLCVLWVDFSVLFGFLFLCSFGLISLCLSMLISCFCLDFSMSVFFWVLISVLFRLWFLCFLLLFQTQYYPTDPTYFNRWPKLPISIRTYDRLRVYFMFTKANRVGCESATNLIRPNSWIVLGDTSSYKINVIKFIILVILLNKKMWCK